MDQDQFYAQIRQGPVFLLLGQHYLRQESGSDPFLLEIVHKFGSNDQPVTGYDHLLSLFQGKPQSDLDAALAWMHRRSDHIAIPLWLKIVADLSWNGVYTSAIDTVWPKAFQSDWRTLQPLLDSDYEPSNPRNRLQLLCTYLFGCVNRMEDPERPPLTARELARRKREALSFLGRLPEILTPFGTLLLEGYAGRHDWLTIDDLLSVIDELNVGQTHLFSAVGGLAEDLRQHSFASDLVKEGKLVLHQESLADCLLRGEEGGYLHLGERPAEEGNGHRIQIDREKVVTLTVPPDLWNRVSHSAIILDDTVLLPDTPVSAAKLYQEFREFLSESDTRPTWSGYHKGLAFARHFEQLLYSEVKSQLELVSTKDLQREPIILHGQTGTGKTIALGKLAYQVRKERRYPVLFIERKTQRPQNADIDTFCKWAEDEGAQACLVIWDGMEEVEQYYNLLQYLVGRGRKVVVVGSHYFIAQDQSRGDSRRRRKNHIEAPATLAPDELEDLDRFLRRFNLSLNEQQGEQRLAGFRPADDTFLVTLYRLLPPTRPRIITGLLSEVGRSEQKMRQFSKEEPLEPIFDSALAAAMYKVGLIDANPFGTSQREEFAGEEVDEFGKLIGLVMVPGSFGLKVPIELLIRVLDKYGVMNFVNLLKRFDIFRWYEDSVGNIAIGPRHPLEARLIMLSRLGGAHFEVQYVQKLLLHVRDKGNNATEIQFAIDLVRNMRPEERLGAGSGGSDERARLSGRSTTRYMQFYRDLAESLGKLREEHSLYNPRLMLQESTLLREAVKIQDMRGSPLANAWEILEKAEAIINLALEHLEKNRRNEKLRGAILVELASIIGTKIRHMLDYGGSRQEIQRLFEQVRDEVFIAQALDSENYYPIDVLAWVTSYILEKGELSAVERADVAAYILHIFERSDIEDFSFDQLERFYVRRDEIAHALGDISLSDESFEALQMMGSRAGYYLRAYRQAGLKPQELVSEPINKAQQNQCRLAADYLEAHRHFIVGDGRCLYLLLRLWWLSHTGKPIFYHERQTVPFTQQDWLYCYLLIQDLMNAGETYRNPPIKYLLGLAAFHTENIQEAFEIFRELEREADYLQGRRRIARSYLASEPDLHMITGKPQVFTGNVYWVESERNRGELYVEQLQRTVRFLPLDFNRPDIRKYESIRFHLAFSFLGPIADPIGYFKAQPEKHA